jgi:hypothetical protein
MRDLAILTFLTLDGVMQAPRLPDEDPSGGFSQGGWAVKCWDEVMEQQRRLLLMTCCSAERLMSCSQSIDLQATPVQMPKR